SSPLTMLPFHAEPPRPALARGSEEEGSGGPQLSPRDAMVSSGHTARNPNQPASCRTGTPLPAPAPWLWRSGPVVPERVNGGLPAWAGGFQWPPPAGRPRPGRAAWLHGDGPVHARI